MQFIIIYCFSHNDIANRCTPGNQRPIKMRTHKRAKRTYENKMTLNNAEVNMRQTSQFISLIFSRKTCQLSHFALHCILFHVPDSANRLAATVILLDNRFYYP